MELKKLTIPEWNELNFRSDTYFANGCLFEENTDNLIAFPVYDSGMEEPVKYMMVVKND